MFRVIWDQAVNVLHNALGSIFRVIYVLGEENAMHGLPWPYIKLVYGCRVVAGTFNLIKGEKPCSVLNKRMVI